MNPQQQPQQLLNEFNQLQNHLLKNPDCINTELTAKLYAFKNAILSLPNIELPIKEDVMTKIVILFPKDIDLYIQAAGLFTTVYVQRAIFWHRIAYNVDPTHANNVVALMKIYLESNIPKNAVEMNKAGELEQFVENPRFLRYYVRCLLQELRFKNGLVYLKKLIKLTSSSTTTKKLTTDEKREKWQDHHDIGYVYCFLGEVAKSLLYTERAYELAVKYKLELKEINLSFSNTLFIHNYEYADNARIFEFARKIHNHYPNITTQYSFARRKDAMTKLYNYVPKNKTSDKSCIDKSCIDKSCIDKSCIDKSCIDKSCPKIKLGYLSSDFEFHPITNFLMPILRNHDRSQFEIVLFANQQEVIDCYKTVGTKIVIIFGKDTKESADLIYAENVDILFEMNGHSVKNRLDVFALNPAPIQIAYLGYPNTTGLTSIQWRITDSVADHPDSTQQYTETLLRMPKCFLLFEPNFQQNAIQPRITNPREIILGSINKENKVSEHVLAVWRQILDRFPTGVKILIKLETFDNTEERMKYYVEKLGESNRSKIEIVNKLQNEDYYKVFGKFDILLDTFPYSGTTTTGNALYNSLPVITMYNKDHHCHNVSASILRNAGLNELVAHSKEEYINIVVFLINNPDKLDYYKKNVNPMFMRSMDIKTYMSSYEGLLVDTYKHVVLGTDKKDSVDKYITVPNKKREEDLKKDVKETTKESVKESNNDNQIVINF